jgi:hypothetical protein
MAENKFAVAALVGAFQDTAEFIDPIHAGTVFTVRRAGSNALQKLARERAKKDKIAVLATSAVLSGETGAIARLAEKSGINPIDVLVHYGEMKLEDALAKLVTWKMDTGTPYDAVNAREFLTWDAPLEKSVCPPAAWEILEEQAKKEWDRLQETLAKEDDATAKPFKGLGEDIAIGEAYQLLIRYWSEHKEGFRAQVLEEAGKN